MLYFAWRTAPQPANTSVGGTKNYPCKSKVCAKTIVIEKDCCLVAGGLCRSMAGRGLVSGSRQERSSEGWMEAELRQSLRQPLKFWYRSYKKAGTFGEDSGAVPKAGLEPARLFKDIGFWVQRVYQFRHSGKRTLQKCRRIGWILQIYYKKLNYQSMRKCKWFTVINQQGPELPWTFCAVCPYNGHFIKKPLY